MYIDIFKIRIFSLYKLREMDSTSDTVTLCQLGESLVFEVLRVYTSVKSHLPPLWFFDRFFHFHLLQFDLLFKVIFLISVLIIYGIFLRGNCPLNQTESLVNWKDGRS